MKAQVHKKNGISIINISGKLEMDKAEPLKKVCLDEFSGQNVIFSLNELNFVGSSGIKTFFQIFRELKDENSHLKFVGLNSDFIRLIELTEDHSFEIYESIDMAINSFLNPNSPSNTPITINPISFRNKQQLEIQNAFTVEAIEEENQLNK